MNLPFGAGWETTEADWNALLKAVVKVNGEMLLRREI